MSQAALELDDSENNYERYIQSLRELKNLAVLVINSSPGSKTTFKQFSKLIESLNSQINEKITELNIQDTPENLQQPSFIPALDERLQGSNLPEFVSQLLGQETFVLGAFEVRPIGGQNNKNWLADDGEGRKFIIRVEGGINPKLLPKAHIVTAVNNLPILKLKIFYYMKMRVL